jgi:hypothetical protein
MGGGGVVASSTGDGATGMPASGGTAGSAAGSTGNHAASGAGGADAGTADAGAGGSGGGAGSGSGGGGRTTDRDAATDAPTRSARGAITFQIGPTPGFVCQHTNGRLSFPFADRGGVEAGLLACDSTTGCKPDEFVFEDGAPDITFGCSVVPNGGNFLVYVNLHVDGSPNMVFGATGILSPSGGTLSINEANSLARGGGTDSACSLQRPPHMSFLESGRIWARFTCTQFRDPNDLSDTGCTVDGAFLFEGCGG